MIKYSKEGWLKPQLISSWTEIVIVLLLYFGNAINVSTRLALKNTYSFNHALRFSNHIEINNILFSSAFIIVMLVYLHYKKWTFIDLCFKINATATVESIPLLIIVKLLGLATFIIFTFLLYKNVLVFEKTEGISPGLHQLDLAWLTLFISPIINACFEEIGCVGYAFNQIAAKIGPWAAFVITILLRLSYHTYQGPNHLPEYAVIFIIFNTYYWNRRNIWTLIVAHSLYNILPLIGLKLHLRMAILS